jgi:3-methyladenine DNA glycosylase AlkD
VGDTTALAVRIEEALRTVGNAERAAKEQQYLHSDLTFLGTGVPAVRSVAKAVWREQPLERDQLHAVAWHLWGRSIHECRMAAVELLVAGRAILLADDSVVIEALIRDAGTWALVDPLAITVAGSLAERFPAMGPVLDEREFFIRKATGWVLREAGRNRPDEVRAWLAPRTHRASGVTMREAVKYLPAEDAARLMDAYRQGVAAD